MAIRGLWCHLEEDPWQRLSGQMVKTYFFLTVLFFNQSYLLSWWMDRNAPSWCCKNIHSNDNITTLQLHNYYTCPLFLIILLESTSLPPPFKQNLTITINIIIFSLCSDPKESQSSCPPVQCSSGFDCCSAINVCHQQALCLFPATPYVWVCSVHSCYRSCLSRSLSHLPQFVHLLKPPETSVHMRFVASACGRWRCMVGTLF